MGEAAPSQPPPNKSTELDGLSPRDPSEAARETAALVELDRIEAAVHGGLTTRVRTRALVLLDQVARWPEVQQARREFGEIVDRIHERVRASGEPEITDDEIQAEVDAVRAERVRAEREAGTG